MFDSGCLYETSTPICAGSLYEDFLCKMSLSGFLRQNSVEPLVQDLRMRIYYAKFLCQDLYIRML